MRMVFRSVVSGLAVVLLAAIVVHAHPMTYQGTVLAVAADKVQVKTADEKTHKTSSPWFTVDKTTKVKRGDALVPFKDAKIAVGERIVVIVDHDGKKMQTTEIRLGKN